MHVALDVNMMVEKLRAMLKFFETDRLFQKGQIRYQEGILRHFRAKKIFKNTQKWTDQT